MGDARLTLRDVVQRTGVNPITLRSWVRRAVIPRGSGRARGTRYSEDHVARIHAVQALRATGLLLEQVAYRLRRMGPDELARYGPNYAASAAANPPSPPPVAPTAVPAPSAAADAAPMNGAAAIASERPVAYAPKTLEWVTLMPGLTLLVDPGGGEMLRRIAHEIVARFALHPDTRTPPG